MTHGLVLVHTIQQINTGAEAEESQAHGEDAEAHDGSLAQSKHAE